MIWKPVVGYEGYYEVSDQGQVRSLDRFGSDGRRLIGKILSPGKLATGHLQVTLFKDGKGKQYKIHRLVYEAFTRPIPPGLFVLHGGNKVTDNSPSNLSLGNQRKNLSEDKNRDNQYTSSSPGVYWNKLRKKWCSQIQIGDKKKYLGSFDSEQEAAEAYRKARP